MGEGWNIRALWSVSRAHYGTVLMLRGEWPAAEVVLSEAAAAPGYPAGGRHRRARATRRDATGQGRTEKALALITRAERHPAAVLSQAAIALERGDSTAAVDGATRYLRLIGGARTERASGLEMVAEAQAAAGRGTEADAAARELRVIAQAVGTDPLLGAARQAEGCAHAAAGSFEEPRGVRGRCPVARARRAPVRGRSSARCARKETGRPRA